MGSIVYGNTPSNLTYIYTASSGGTVFSANRNATAAFDYFGDSAVVDDAVYFGRSGGLFADITLNIGTAMAGTSIVLAWEFWDGSIWSACTDLTDNSAGFTLTGARTVVVPWQRNWMFCTVNGVSANWIRCRIVSLSAITEGGANSTATVKAHNGIVYVNDYTDGTPCTFTEIYNWMLANHPECNCSKNANIFAFPQCGLSIASRTTSTLEVIVLGDNQAQTSTNPPYYSLAYLTAGYKSGSVGYGGSTIVYNGYPVSTVAVLVGAETKLYGSVVMSAAGRLHYADCRDGDWCNVLVMTRGPWQFTAGTFVNCTFQGVGILSSAIAATFTNCSFYSSSDPAHLYNAGLTLRDPTWSAAYFAYLYLTFQDIVVNLVNPNPALPGNGFINAAVRLGNYQSGNVAKAFFYDDSAGTYTDITTAVTNATTNDITMSGDVGDCIYLCRSTSTAQTFPTAIVVTASSTNDYVYVIEQYMNSAWRTMTVIFDGSNNFQQNGEIWTKNTSYYSFTSIAINGTTGYWLRIRIATKGTGSPTASKFTWRGHPGSCNWQINEQYQFDVNVKDKAGVAIDGATVTVYDNTGAAIASETTDANGDIAQQELTTGRYALSPLDYTAGDGYIKKTGFNPLVLKVSAPGYETYRDVISLGAKTGLEIALRQSASPGRDEMGVGIR